MEAADDQRPQPQLEMPQHDRASTVAATAVDETATTTTTTTKMKELSDESDAGVVEENYRGWKAMPYIIGFIQAAAAAASCSFGRRRILLLRRRSQPRARTSRPPICALRVAAVVAFCGLALATPTLTVRTRPPSAAAGPSSSSPKPPSSPTLDLANFATTSPRFDLSRNVSLIRELNINILRVVDLYDDLFSLFAASDTGHKRIRSGLH